MCGEKEPYKTCLDKVYVKRYFLVSVFFFCFFSPKGGQLVASHDYPLLPSSEGLWGFYPASGHSQTDSPAQSIKHKKQRLRYLQL